MNAPNSQDIQTNLAAPYIFTALSNLQKEVSESGIAKTLSATDKGGNELYKARGIDAVYNLLSPLFAKHQITIGIDCLETTKTSAQIKSSIQHQTLVKVKYTFISMQDASSHSITMYGEAIDYADKGMAKALSMAFKYACFQMLCIPVCEDPDAIVHEQVSAHDYQPTYWTQDNAQPTNSNLQYSQNNNNGYRNDHQNRNSNGQSHNNGHARQNNGHYGQNNSYSNHGTGCSGNNQVNRQANGQNTNGEPCITQQQVNHLLSKLQLLNRTPNKILNSNGIQNLNQLKVSVYSGLIQRIEEQLYINHQNNQQKGGAYGSQGHYA